MLTILTVVHLSWFVLFCCALSLVQGATEHSRDSTDFAEASANKALPANCKSCADDQSPNLRLARATSGSAERLPIGVQRPTISPDLISQYRDRQRKKQWRILETLIQLNGIMGSRNQSSSAAGGEGTNPRVSGVRSLSASDEESITRRLDENYAEKLIKDPNLSRVITLLPSCPSTTPAKNKAFRLFFSIIPAERTIRTPIINVKTAVLHLKRKTLKSDLIHGKFDASANRKYKGKRANAASEHVTKWKVRIQVYNMPKGETKSAVKYFDLDPRNSTQWVKVNIRKVVEEWLKTSRRNLGLQLTIVNGRNQTIHPAEVFHNFNCDQSRNTPAKVTQPSGDGKEDNEGGVGLAGRGRPPVVLTNDLSSVASIPYLDVVLAKSPPSATKRIVRHLPKKKNICEAIPVLVKIEDLKGKWKKNIINPKSFQSNVCRGTCHRCLAQPVNSTLSLNGGGGDSDGCCQPIKWKSPKAIIIDDEGIVRVRHIPILAVTKCGCRR